MRLNVCAINEMVPFRPFSAIVEGKTPFDSNGPQKDICARDEIADLCPVRMCYPIEKHGFAEGFVYFRKLCGVQSVAERFALRIVGSRAVRSEGKQGEKSCAFCLRRSELSA